MSSSDLGQRFLAVRAGTTRCEADIYRLYAEMRRASPLWRSPWDDVYLSSYNLVTEALVNRDMSHALWPGSPIPHGQDFEESPIADWLLFMDGTNHTLLRRAFQGPFVESDGSLSGRVAMIVEEQLNGVTLDSPIDAVTQFTRIIPERVIGGLLGVPHTDLSLFRSWSEEIRTTLDIGMESVAAGNADAASDLTDYFYDMVTRKAGGSTIVGEFDLTELSDEIGIRAAAANLAFIAFAGYETTVHLLGSMLLLLSKTPTVWHAVREKPELAPLVVAEALRLESPVQKVCRWALADIEFSGGHKLNKGEYVVCLLGAANRDPSRFSDPDRISLAQAQNAHIAFGKGLHSCLGRALAVIEGTAVLQWLVKNVQEISLDSSEIEWIPNSSFRGLQRLPITLRG